MRFMIIVKANRDSEAGVMPTDELLTAMADYHDQLAKAGVLLGGSGLQPSAKGFRVRYAGAERSVVDGPFADAPGLIAGYTVIKVDTKQEAVAWARRMPNPHGEGAEGEIEVRQMFELEDFEPSVTVERFREINIGGA